MAKKKKPKHLKHADKEENKPLSFTKLKLSLIFKPANQIVFQQVVNIQEGMPSKEIVSKFLSQFTIHHEEVGGSKKLIIVKNSNITPYIKNN